MIMRPIPANFVIILLGLLFAGLIAGCASTPPPTTERGILGDVTQLTSGFDRAGEAYFSPKMDWIIFQATPHGEADYQMYVAPLNLGLKNSPTTAPSIGSP